MSGKAQSYQSGNVDVEKGLQSSLLTEDLAWQHRLGFIRKVYGILLAQLLLTAAVCAAFMFNPSMVVFAANNLWLYYTSIVLTVVFLIPLQILKSAVPVNFILLALWTLFISYGVGFICGIYSAVGYGDLVLEALLITASVFLGLTAYTFISKKDFSFLGAGLSSALWVLIAWGFINLFVGVPGGLSDQLYCLAGAAIFCLYIIFDTFLLINKYSYDDYVSASIQLYLDIINLFLYILRLLASFQKRN